MSVMSIAAAAAIAVASISGAPEEPGEGAVEAPGTVTVEESATAPTSEVPEEEPTVDPSVPDEIEGAGPDAEEAPTASENDGTGAPHERGVAGLPVCGPYTPIGEGCYSEIIGGGVWQWEDGSVTYTWDDGRMITIFPDGSEERSGDWSGHRMPWDEEPAEEAFESPEAAPSTQSDTGVAVEPAGEGTQSDTLVDGRQSVTRTELAATGSEHVLIGVAVAVVLILLGTMALWIRRDPLKWVAVGESEDGNKPLTFSNWNDFLVWIHHTQVSRVIQETGDREYAERIMRACNIMVVTQGEEGWQEMANLTGVRVYPIS